MNKKKNTKAYMLVPNDAEIKEIMHQRAQVCAEIFENKNDTEVGTQYIKFKLGQNELYGIEFNFAKAVVQASNMKKPPCVSPTICGVINYQGKLIGVIDLEKILSLKHEAKDSDKIHNIVIVNAGQMTVGIVVGEIEMSDSYKSDTLEDSLLSDADIQHGFIKGIDKGKISIINVEKIMTSIKITEGEVL